MSFFKCIGLFYRSCSIFTGLFSNVLDSFIGLVPYIQVSFHIKLHDLDYQPIDVHDSTQVYESLSLFTSLL